MIEIKISHKHQHKETIILFSLNVRTKKLNPNRQHSTKKNQDL